jgi:hypothetical protein
MASSFTWRAMAAPETLAAAAQAVRCQLAEWLTDWDDRDLAAFGDLVGRFNQSTSRAYCTPRPTRPTSQANALPRV